MAQKNASHWKLEEPLKPGESCNFGWPNKADADNYAARLQPLNLQVRVELRNTREHDLPIEDPLFDVSQVFTSTRWCVIIKEQ